MAGAAYIIKRKDINILIISNLTFFDSHGILYVYMTDGQS